MQLFLGFRGFGYAWSDVGVRVGWWILPDHSLQAAFTCNPACAYYGASTIGRVPNKTPGPAWIVR